MNMDDLFKRKNQSKEKDQFNAWRDSSLHTHTETELRSDMYTHPQSPFFPRGADSDNYGACVADDSELLQSAGNEFYHLDSADDLTTKCSNSMYNGIKSSNVSVVSSNSLFGGLPNTMLLSQSQSLGSAETGLSSAAAENGQFLLHDGGPIGTAGGDSGGTARDEHFHNCGDFSQRTQASTDNELTGLIAGDSTDQSKGRIRGQKELVKLAQNREAARKSRMRKKAYVQELESSQQRLTQLDHALRRARRQGILVASEFSGYQSNSMGGSGFDTDHASWLDEHQRLIDNLRSALNSYVGDTQLHLHVDAVVSHYDQLFRIKNSGAKWDMFHVLSGLWRSPVERCLMWLGGFRSSDLLKVLEKQIQPLTEQQLVGICNLQQSCQEAEDALSQGMEALQLSLVDTLSPTSDYMSQMAAAMGKIATIENFLNQADVLRLNTLQQLQRILTTRQAARALLAINEYKSRLQALSSLWLARPK